MKIYSRNSNTVAHTKRLTSDWMPDDIAQYENLGEVKQWLAWHAMSYQYDRIYDRGNGLDAIMLMPSTADVSRVWVSNHSFGFISDMIDTVRNLFIHDEPRSGQRFMVRPGKPRPVILRRIWITSGS